MKRIVNHILIAAVALAATSCKLGHRYGRPEVELPRDYYSRWQAEGDTLSLADRSWWEIYTDSTLRHLIDRTLANNNNLLAASERIRELAAMRRQSTAALLPAVSGQAYGQKEALDYGGDNFKPDPEVGLKAIMSWEADLWGNLRWGRDRSTADFLASVESYRGLQVSLVAQTASAYFELVALDNELSIVRQTLAAREEGMRIARLRFEGGLTSETAYQQARVEHARTATLIPALERDIALKENEIRLICGDVDLDVRRTRRFRDESDMPTELPVGLSSGLLLRRPDVRRAEQRLIAANAAVGQAYTDRFPRLTLTAQYGLESDEMRDFLKSPMYYLSAGLLGPIFDGGRRQAAYRARQAAYRAAEHEYRQTVITAFTEVRDAIISYSRAHETYSSWLQLEKSAKSAMELVQLQYVNGVVSYINVLDAQRSYFDAQVGMSNAVRDRHICLVRLYQALGGGWDYPAGQRQGSGAGEANTSSQSIR